MIRSQRYRGISQHPRGFMGFGGGDDNDAATFLEVAAITDSAQQRAIYELVRLLKQYGLWSKMKAVYPFIGGTATTHKWNLKDPRDLDAAFRLLFNGGWTHSDTGAKPNGTNAYANTNLIASNVMSANNTHMAFYSRTDQSQYSTTMGCTGNTALSQNHFRLLIGHSPGTVGGTSNRAFLYFGASGTIGNQRFINDDSRGFYIGNAPNSTTRKFYKNGDALTPAASSGLGIDACPKVFSIYIGANNFVGAAQEYAPNEAGFASIGDGLTDTEAANLFSAVDKYQRLLSRNV